MNKELTAGELRIGNMVNLCFHEKAGWFPAKVTGVHSDNSIDTDTEETTKYYYEGIPLTSEWLIKAGFEARGDTGQYFIGEQTVSVSFDRINFWLGDSGFGKTIKYVHQLQNIYFALNEAELTLTN